MNPDDKAESIGIIFSSPSNLWDLSHHHHFIISVLIHSMRTLFIVCPCPSWGKDKALRTGGTLLLSPACTPAQSMPVAAVTVKIARVNICGPYLSDNKAGWRRGHRTSAAAQAGLVLPVCLSWRHICTADILKPPWVLSEEQDFCLNFDPIDSGL